MGEVEIGALVDRLDRDEFTATCWARDLTTTNPSTEPVTPLEVMTRSHVAVESDGILRKEFMDGVELLVLGLEFPLKSAIVIGTIIAVTRRCALNSESFGSVDYLSELVSLWSDRMED